jgi:hypothetical protein
MATETVTAARSIDKEVGRFCVKALKGKFDSAKYLRVRVVDENGAEKGQPEVLRASEFEDAKPTSELIVSHDSPLAPTTGSSKVSCGPVGVSQYLLFRLARDKVLGLLSLLLILQLLGAGVALGLSVHKYGTDLTVVTLASLAFSLTSLASLIGWFMAFDKLDKS